MSLVQFDLAYRVLAITDSSEEETTGYVALKKNGVPFVKCTYSGSRLSNWGTFVLGPFAPIKRLAQLSEAGHGRHMILRRVHVQRQARQSLLINLKLETSSTRSAKQRLPLSVGTFLSRYLCLSRSGMLLHLQPITDAN